MGSENLSEKNHQKIFKSKKKVFYFQKWGYSPRDFKKWGKLGGRPAKYVSNAERWKAYRRRKAQAKIDSGEVKGILNMTTGRISKRKVKG